MPQRLRSIRNIRIIDSKQELKSRDNSPLTTSRTHVTTARQNRSPCQANRHTQSHADTRRERSVSPLPKNIPHFSSKPNGKDEQDKLRQMLSRLRAKQKKQIQILEQLQIDHEKYKIEKARNHRLKGELTEMKDLMKELLLEREQLRMFSFYQDHEGDI